MGLLDGMHELLARRRELVAAGAQPLGWKVGLNNAEVQERLGIDSSVVGYLTDETLAAPGSTVSLDGWVRPMLEAEIAVRVGEGGKPIALAPAIELVDIAIGFDDIEEILVRNVFHRTVIFGDDVDGASAVGLSARVTVDDTEAAVADVAYEPAAVLAQVSRFLEAHGAVLTPGERVIAGTITPPMPVAAGQRIEVEIGALGSVAVELT